MKKRQPPQSSEAELEDFSPRCAECRLRTQALYPVRRQGQDALVCRACRRRFLQEGRV